MRCPRQIRFQMVFGALYSAAGFAIYFFKSPADAAIIVWAGGMIFGLGYGRWLGMRSMGEVENS